MRWLTSPLLLSMNLRHLLQRLPAWLLAAACLCAAFAARGQDHITERAWMADDSGQMSWEEARQREGRSFSGPLSLGFGGSAVWLRLRVDPSAHPEPARGAGWLVLRIRPVYLDDIQVFDPLAPQGLAGVLGMQHHPRDDLVEGLDYLLPIPRGEAARDIWLRMATTSTRQIDVQALNQESLDRVTRQQALAFSAYVSLVFIFAVWGIVHWFVSREHLIGVFGIKQGAALAFALGSLGFLRAFWPAEWPAEWLYHATKFFSIAAVSAAVLFHVLLLREFSPPAWARRVQLGLLALFPLKVGLLMAGWPMQALRLNMLEVLVAPLIFLLSAGFARGWTSTQQRPVLSRSVVLGFYAALLAMLVLASLPGLGLVAAGEVALYLVQSHGMVTALLVMLMLQYRSLLMQRQQRQTAIELEHSRQQSRQDRAIRDEQAKLLAMLAHELKTPLATMHLRLDANATGTREIRQAIRDMNAVIERCVQATQLADSQLRARLEPIDLASLLRDAVSSCPDPARVRLDAPDRLPLQTDKQLMFVILNNLLENACKYAAPGSPIQVRARVVIEPAAVAPVLALDVSNPPGPAGWPSTDQIFEKYYRSPHARRQAGTGLGLFLVRSLVHVLGGRIDYEPDDGNIRFTLRMPVAGADAPPAGTRAALA